MENLHHFKVILCLFFRCVVSFLCLTSHFRPLTFDLWLTSGHHDPCQRLVSGVRGRAVCERCIFLSHQVENRLCEELQKKRRQRDEGEGTLMWIVWGFVTPACSFNMLPLRQWSHLFMLWWHKLVTCITACLTCHWLWGSLWQLAVTVWHKCSCCPHVWVGQWDSGTAPTPAREDHLHLHWFTFTYSSEWLGRLYFISGCKWTSTAKPSGKILPPGGERVC